MSSRDKQQSSVWTSWRMLGLHLVLWFLSLQAAIVIPYIDYLTLVDLREYTELVWYCHLFLLTLLLGLSLSDSDALVKCLAYCVISIAIYSVNHMIYKNNISFTLFLGFTLTCCVMFLFNLWACGLLRRYRVVDIRDYAKKTNEAFSRSAQQWSLLELLCYVTILALFFGIAYFLKSLDLSIQSKFVELIGWTTIVAWIISFYIVCNNFMSIFIPWRKLFIYSIILIGVEGFFYVHKVDAEMPHHYKVYYMMLLLILLTLLYRWAGLRIVPLAAEQPTTKPMRVKEQPVVSPFED